MIDYTKDQNPTYLYKAIEVLGDSIPESIITAEIPTDKDVAGLKKQAFADQSQLLFPCYDEATVFMSACNIYGKNVADSNVIGNLEKMASFFELTDLVNQVKDIFAPQIEKQASNIEKFALVIEENGQETGFLPISDILEIDNTCAEWVDARRNSKLPSDLLKQAAVKICDAATRLGAIDSVPAIIKEASEEKLMDFSELHRQIQFRVNNLMDEEQKELYIKMASDLTEDNHAEWVEVFDLLDSALLSPEVRRHELYKTAHETIFSGMPVKELEKIASEHISVYIGDDLMLLPHKDLNLISDDELRKFYPTETANLLKQAKATQNMAEATSLFDKIDLSDKIDFLTDLKERVQSNLEN